MSTSITETLWLDVCPISVILPFTGVAALIAGEQVAIFRLASENDCYAISNYDCSSTDLNPAGDADT